MLNTNKNKQNTMINLDSNTNPNIKPFLKWAGGKRQLLPILKSSLPQSFLNNTAAPFIEPFVGAGAFFLDLQRKNVYINDSNKWLINTYNCIKNHTNDLVDFLSLCSNNKTHYLLSRNKFNTKWIFRDHELGSIKETRENINKAVDFIYLNKTCFNGLFRVNKSGNFNVPFGNYKNPNICDSKTLFAISDYFKENNVIISNLDFKEFLHQKFPEDAFFYFDPPYDPLSKSSNFTSYSQTGFSHQNQTELRECCDELNKQGLKWMLSNSDTPFIRDQYSNYNISVVSAKRSINSDASKRGVVNELLIKNYH